MFWNFATTSNIDNILDKENVTLIELMDDDDVLQECKGHNTKLVKFLCQPDVMEELVSLVISEPDCDSDEAMKYKYPNIACELLTSDVPQMNDLLGDTESLREKLFSFLDNDPVLNPLLASFFSKVVGILLSRKPEPTLTYIRAKSDFLGSVLKHLETSAIMDLLLRLVTCVEAADLRAQVLSWLNENKLVERLIALIDPSVNDDFHCNSAQSLCDIIRLSREHMYTMQESAQEDPLLNTLERKETVQLLLRHMFDKELNESVIVNGITVLLALLEIRRPAPYGFPELAQELTQLDVERLASGVSKTLHGLSDSLEDFHKLLENPPERLAMECTFGELDPPLGNTRIHVGKLLSAILITNTHNINVQISELQMFNSLLELFFRYEYNNFLHTQVVQCIQTVLSNAVTVGTASTRSHAYSDKNNANEEDDDEELENPRKVAPLLTHLFEDCRLLHRIIDAWEDNNLQESEGTGHRKGYMGHLTVIANQILENMQKGPNCDRIKLLIEGMPEEDQGRWQKFVAETLAEMNEKNIRELGGHNPMHFSSDEDADYRDIPFSTNSAQQAFTDYQLQQITSDFIDQFGFTDTDFGDQDDVDSKFNKINSIEFDIKANTHTTNQELFEDVCRARLPNFGDSSDDDDEEDDNVVSGSNDGFDDLVNKEDADSPFQFGSATPTITVRMRSSSGDSAGISANEDCNSPSEIGAKVNDVTGKMDSQPRNEVSPAVACANLDDSIDNSSSVNSSVAVSNSLISLVSDSQQKSSSNDALNPPTAVLHEDNWANFDDLKHISTHKSASQGNEFATAQASDRSTAYALPDLHTETAVGNKAQNEDMNNCENMAEVRDSVFSSEEICDVELSSGDRQAIEESLKVNQELSSHTDPSLKTLADPQQNAATKASSGTEKPPMEVDGMTSSIKAEEEASDTEKRRRLEGNEKFDNEDLSSMLCDRIPPPSSRENMSQMTSNDSESSDAEKVGSSSSPCIEALRTVSTENVSHTSNSSSPKISVNNPAHALNSNTDSDVGSNSTPVTDDDSGNASSKDEDGTQINVMTSSDVQEPPKMDGPA